MNIARIVCSVAVKIAVEDSDQDGRHNRQILLLILNMMKAAKPEE
jgi:hypothetical protein